MAAGNHKIFVAAASSPEASARLLQTTLQCLVREGDEIHVAACLVTRDADKDRRLEQARERLQQQMDPVLKAKNGVKAVFHVLTVQPCHNECPAHINMRVAQQLCVKATALKCRVVAVGGRSEPRPASGGPAKNPSTTRLIVDRSSIPVFLATEGRLAMPRPVQDGLIQKLTAGWRLRSLAHHGHHG